jgi:transposase
MQSNKENYKSGTGHYIRSQVKYIVKNAYKVLREQQPKSKQKDVINDIIKITKLSRASIYNILKSNCDSPKKTKKRVLKFTFKPKDFVIIDDIIWDFNKNKVFPSINDVYKVARLNKSLSFKNCGRRTFYKILKKMGYKYSDTKKLLKSQIMNRPDIKKKRINYLIEKRNIEKLLPNSPFVYIDETFIHKNYVKYKILQPFNNSKKLRFKMSIGKGTRFSIIHAGNEDGFIIGAEEIFVNSEINSQLFEKWLKEKLLPNVPPCSVIVLDNAPTHSKQYNKAPVNSDNITTIRNWLKLNNISFKQNFKKSDLLKLVKENTFNYNYNVDKIIRDSGQIPLRLPPYHCELNPIELIWAQLKELISKHNFNNNTQEFKNLISEAFAKINDNFWRKCIRHTTKIESDFWISDKIIYNNILSEHNYVKKYHS